IAVAQKTRAERNKDSEKTQREVAQAAFKKMIDEVQKQLKDTEAMPEEVRELRKKMLVVGVEGLEKIAAVAAKNLDLEDKDPGLPRRARASAYFEIGKMYFADLNDAEKAADNYQKAFALLEPLARENPNSDKDRGNLALAHTKLGESHLQTGKGAGKALEEFRKGLAIREDIRDHPPDKSYSADAARAMVADSYRKLALVATRLGDPVQARKIYLDILQYQQGEGRKSFKDPDDFVHAQAGLYQSLTDVSWRL